MITLSSGVYLTEINVKPAYTLFPIYERPGATAVVDAKGKLYVQDGNRLMVLDSKL